MEKARTLNSNSEYSLNFEYTMMLLFGNKAGQLASLATNESEVRKWLRKFVKKLIEETNSLDTTERHRAVLSLDLKSIDKNLKDGGNIWEIIYYLFNLVARLFGYDFHEGKKLLTLCYLQNQSQNFWTNLYEGQSFKEIQKKQKNFVLKRVQLVKELKREGFLDFEISQILNTTEYNIKKILKES